MEKRKENKMKYEISQIGWVTEDETFHKTIKGNANSGPPFRVYGIGKKDIQEIIEQLMYASNSDCQMETSKKAKQRKITVTVECKNI